jgi:hypothetical protein
VSIRNANENAGRCWSVRLTALKSVADVGTKTGMMQAYFIFYWEVKMNPKQIAKQMIAFNKTVFDNNFHTMQTLHEQMERAVNKFWGKSHMFPEEGKNVIADWMMNHKKGCADFKNMVDDNFKKVDDFLKSP